MRYTAPLIALMLAACLQATIYERIDGRRIRDDAALTRQFEVDKTICDGESSKTAAVADYPIRQRAFYRVFDGCMAQRGYMVRPQ